jgi:hypothetical protein
VSTRALQRSSTTLFNDSSHHEWLHTAPQRPGGSDARPRLAEAAEQRLLGLFEGLLLRGPEHDDVLVGDRLVGLLPEA